MLHLLYYLSQWNRNREKSRKVFEQKIQTNQCESNEIDYMFQISSTCMQYKCHFIHNKLDLFSVLSIVLKFDWYVKLILTEGKIGGEEGWLQIK